MLFELYTRIGILNRLDAKSHVVRRPVANVAPARFRGLTRFAWSLTLSGWMLLIPTSLATAQSAATPPNAGSSPPTNASTEKPPVHRAAHHHHRAKPQAATAAPAPVAPPPPVPPAEQPPSPASIVFSDGLLTVRAQNSSLVGILDQIQHQTGLVIDGLGHDQRMYGQYGPGSISTTLSALLDGSGYDFVIVGGGSGQTAPRLVLSMPGSAGATTPPPAVSTDATQPADGDQAEPADPTAPPQPKSPQEIFNEMRRAHPQ